MRRDTFGVEIFPVQILGECIFDFGPKLGFTKFVRNSSIEKINFAKFTINKSISKISDSKFVVSRHANRERFHTKY